MNEIISLLSLQEGEASAEIQVSCISVCTWCTLISHYACVHHGAARWADAWKESTGRRFPRVLGRRAVAAGPSTGQGFCFHLRRTKQSRLGGPCLSLPRTNLGTESRLLPMNWVPFSILDALEFPWRSPEPPTLAGTVSKRHGHSLGREGETGPRLEVARSPPPAPPWALTHSLPSWQTLDGHLVVHSHARVSSLTLKSIQYTDAGEYVCTASNTIGQDSQSMYLEVQCEPQLWKDEGRGLCRVGLKGDNGS